MKIPKAGVVLALTGLVLTGVPATARAATPQAPVRAAAKLPSGHSWKVTLLTGDVVQVTTVANRPPLVSVRPRPDRRSVAFRKDVLPDGTVRVVPQDVAAQVGTVYDPALFDVTTLIEEGDDDAKRPDLPLIVQGGSAKSLTTGGRTLTSLGATAVRRPKAQAGSALAGVRHVWLDRRIHTQALDHNLDQIGAPAAWNAGATGKGVKVAVLDSGVDATHPDMKGRIAEQKNFSASTDTVDHFGHGTHVASIIAGSGASANGERRGVAPEADLLVCKVLDDYGYGNTSDLIAGMEWAAPKARIVSMSLGGGSDDPANDPLTKAVDQLTAAHNTLFVVAAGNAGPGENTIEVPGVAASALTVGAVDGQDKVADFSSRGGMLLKPEIAAPGVGIVAARAKGTAMGHVLDANYTSADGTSMATPHVAGAAADLLQKHPGWTAARLKAALVSTADATPNTFYAAGSGRLDVGTATTATVVGDQAAAAFGSVPHGSTAALTKWLSWSNSGTTPVKLHLAAKVTDAGGHDISGALSLTPTVTVPAGGSAGALLALNPRRLTTAGSYGGAVTAQAPGVSLRTPVAAFAQPETHALTVKATALPDTPDGALAGSVDLVDIDDPALFSGEATFGADGTATIQVPDGRYAAFGVVRDGTTDKVRMALAGNAELSVHADTTLPLDASHAQPLRISAPGTTLDPQGMQGLLVERAAGNRIWSASLAGLGGSPVIYTTPIPAVATGTFRAYAFARLLGSGKDATDVQHFLGAEVPATVDYQVDPASLAQINERYYSLNGDTFARYGRYRAAITPAGFLTDGTWSNLDAPTTRTDHVTTEPGTGWAENSQLEFTADHGLWVVPTTIRNYSPGSTRTNEWLRQPFRPGPFSGNGTTDYAFCLPGPSTRSRGNIHVELVELQYTPDGFDCMTGDYDWTPVTTRSMKMYAGSTLLGSTTRSRGDFSVPVAAGTYRLHYDMDATQVLPVSTRTSTDWTFTSRPEEERIPLLVVDYRLPLDIGNLPTGDQATFTVSRVPGAAPAKVTGLKLWTSLDEGATWQAADVSGTDGTYTATLPHAGSGQSVSLRVQATDADGGQIDQTLIRAYFGA